MNWAPRVATPTHVAGQLGDWSPPPGARAQVGLCEPCSKGQTCNCSTPCNCKKVKVAGIEVVVGGWAPRALAQVGLFDAERAVPWTQVAEFNAIAEQFITEVTTWLQGLPTQSPEVMTYNMRFNLWQTHWRTWFAVTAEPGFFDLSIVGIKILRGDKLLEFDKLRAEYDEVRRQAIDLGAPIAAEAAPKDKNVEAAEGFGKRIEEGLDLAGTIAKYGGLALLVVGVGYVGLLLLPTLSAGIARRAAS